MYIFDFCPQFTKFIYLLYSFYFRIHSLLIQWICSFIFLSWKNIFSVRSFRFVGFYDVMLSFLTREITRKEKRSLKKQITFHNDHFIKFSLYVVIIALTLLQTTHQRWQVLKVKSIKIIFNDLSTNTLGSFVPCFETF